MRNSFQSTLCPLLLAVLSAGSYAFAQTAVEVEPGITIPNMKTPWALETYQGNRQLEPIHHSTVTVNHHSGANLAGSLAGSIFYKPKLTTELSGLNSRNQLHSKTPVIYVLFDSDNDDAGDGTSADTCTFILVHAQQDKDKRIIDKMAFTQLTGNAKHNVDVVEADVTQMPNHWYRIQPKVAMPEGEYALLPIWKIKGTTASVVWDFGINLSAPNEKDVVLEARP